MLKTTSVPVFCPQRRSLWLNVNLTPAQTHMTLLLCPKLARVRSYVCTLAVESLHVALELPPLQADAVGELLARLFTRLLQRLSTGVSSVLLALRHSLRTHTPHTRRNRPSLTRMPFKVPPLTVHKVVVKVIHMNIENLFYYSFIFLVFMFSLVIALCAFVIY